MVAVCWRSGRAILVRGSFPAVDHLSQPCEAPKARKEGQGHEVPLVDAPIPDVAHQNAQQGIKGGRFLCLGIQET